MRRKRKTQDDTSLFVSRLEANGFFFNFGVRLVALGLLMYCCYFFVLMMMLFLTSVSTAYYFFSVSFFDGYFSIELQ